MNMNDDTRRRLLEWGACDDGMEWAVSTGLATLAELWTALCASEHHAWVVWLGTREGVLPRETLKAFSNACAERAVRAAMERCADAKWREWAERWLTVEDRSAAAAAAAFHEAASRVSAAWAEAARAARVERVAAAARAAAWESAADAGRVAWSAARSAARSSARSSAAAWAVSHAAAQVAADRAVELRAQADWLRQQPNPFRKEEE